MFYVIEHYVDGRYKFSGLTSFTLYLMGRHKPTPTDETKSESQN